jgi:hypothetical protein
MRGWEDATMSQHEDGLGIGHLAGRRGGIQTAWSYYFSTLPESSSIGIHGMKL